MATTHELCDHLFRHQSAKMVAVLVRVLGHTNVELAEDVVQDVLCRALETWKYGRLPESPEAWLMQAAKNRAIDIVRRRERFSDMSTELARHVESERGLVPEIEASFEEASVQDGLLRLAFSCCDPSVGVESQEALILKYLCGFSVREIARAFLTSEETIEKRLSRARAALKASPGIYEFASEELARERLPTVLHALYLLFNEGYHGANDEVAVREELCLEALRLASMLADHSAFGTPEAKALVALMCLHGARLPARLDEDRELVTFAGQDRSRWNQELLAAGIRWLADSASGDHAGEYHLEAAIAGHHAVASSLENTDWAAIRGLYDALFRIKPSPVVALNRAIALGLAEGPGAGIAALETLPGRERLENYPFYSAALGDMHLRGGSVEMARKYFAKAKELARNAEERRFLERRLAEVSETRGRHSSDRPHGSRRTH
jgi:RNA polymerase sigma factor (sigma-70 family)